MVGSSGGRRGFFLENDKRILGKVGVGKRVGDVRLSEGQGGRKLETAGFWRCRSSTRTVGDSGLAPGTWESPPCISGPWVRIFRNFLFFNKYEQLK